MKILIFIEDLRSGGKERRLVELVKGLNSDNEFELQLVLTRDEIHYKDVLNTGIKINVIKREKFSDKLAVFYRFYQIAQTFKPDIIHVWGNIVAIIAIPSKFILQKVMVNNQITNTTTKDSKLFFGSRLTFLFSDLIVSNSQKGLNVYNAPLHKSRVIYNGFDFKRVENLLPKTEILNKFGINTKFVVGMVATFNKNKDYNTYIQAAKHILKINKEVTFLCIGSGDFQFYQSSLTDQEKNRILFLGRQVQVESIMNVCDVGVLTTNLSFHGEGISNSILEFSALGKPVIATNGGGTPEIIEHNYSGFLIGDQSVTELEERLIYLLSHEEARFLFGLRAMEIVEKKFSIQKMINQFKTVFKEI